MTTFAQLDLTDQLRFGALVIGDVHLGNHRKFAHPGTGGINTRFRYTLGVLKQAVERAASRNLILVVAGDLFDTDRPTPQMVAEVQHVFASAVVAHGREPFRPILLVGNHDMSGDDPLDNALAPLWQCATIIDEPTLVRCHFVHDFRKPKKVIYSLFCGPYRSGDAATWVARDVIDCKKNSVDAYVTHVGIVSASTPPWLRAATDAVPLELICEAAPVIAAGNWHGHAVYGTGANSREDDDQRIYQIGALCPTGFDNPRNWRSSPMVEYGTAIALFENGYRDRVISFETVDFCKVKVGELQAFELSDPWVYARVHRPTFVKISCDSLEELAKAKAWAETQKLTTDDNRPLRGIEYELTASARAFSREASRRAAARAGSVEAAVAAFVGKLDLPEEIDRSALAEKAIEYLR